MLASSDEIPQFNNMRDIRRQTTRTALADLSWAFCVEQTGRVSALDVEPIFPHPHSLNISGCQDNSPEPLKIIGSAIGSLQLSAPKRISTAHLHK